MNTEPVEGPSADYPRPAGPVLTFTDLRPADILLSRGDSRISDLIVEADRASYSHGALWSGTGIIESTLKGGVEEHAPTGTRYVYRYRDSRQAHGDGGLLSDGEAKTIVEWARMSVGQPYDTSEIYLLAATFNRWWPTARPRRSLAGALLEVLGARGSRLEDWLQSVYGRSAPRICTELVALAYLQSNQALKVLAPKKRPAPALAATPAVAAAQGLALAETDMDRPDGDDLKELNTALGTMLWGDRTAGGTATDLATAGTRGLLFGDLAYDADTGVAVGIVTPGDLQFSPSLEFVGALSAPA